MSPTEIRCEAYNWHTTPPTDQRYAFHACRFSDRFAPKDSERIINSLDEMWLSMSKHEKALIRKRCRSK